MIHAQRACAIVIERKQAHQMASAVFGEWIECDQALGIADGGNVVALYFKEAQKVFEDLPVALTEPLSLRQDPFIIAARQ